MTIYITSDTIWSGEIILSDKTYVSDCCLTIEEGTYIKVTNTFARLIINSDATINAIGTKTNPIIFNIEGIEYWGGVKIKGKKFGNNISDSKKHFKYVGIYNINNSLLYSNPSLYLYNLHSDYTINNMYINGGTGNSINIYNSNVILDNIYCTSSIVTDNYKGQINQANILDEDFSIFLNSLEDIKMSNLNNLINTEISNLDINLDDSIKTKSGQLIGDPHITTISGYRYHFDYLGYFRILETDNIIINGLSIKGTQRWKNKQYIRKILIKYEDKILIADLGFRGEKCYIEKNDGFETIETELDFNPERKIHCFNRYCLKEFSTENEAKRHLRKTRNRHKVLMPIRNQIEIKISNILVLIISNVNEFNFQPCRMKLKPLYKLQNPKGPIINSIYANDCIKLDDLYDFKKIEYNNLKKQELDDSIIKPHLI